MEKLNKLIESKSFHIVLIILGAIIILSSSFFTEIWYDESYTMALVRHDFTQIIEIGSQDVHPILYYLMLKIVITILGDSIIVARIFSMVPAILTGILGFTHIRKDFGSKVGLLFSFLVFALPVMPSYGAEIRMYTWSLFFVTVAAIYAYRISRKNSLKNWGLFAIASLAAAHCHYYGLATVAIINMLLLLHILFTKKETIKNARKSYLIHFGITAVLQILGYLPWLFIFLNQAKSVSQGFWIPLNFRDSVLAPLAVQFHGVLGVDFSFWLAGAMYLYFIHRMLWHKMNKIEEENGKENRINTNAIVTRNNKIVVPIYCLVVHLILFLSMLAVSIAIKPIMYYRYMVVVIAMLIFPLAYFLANCNTKIQKTISILIVIIILGLSIYDNSVRIKENYHASNGEEIRYLKEQYDENTILLYSDIFLASSLAEQLPEYNWYQYLGDETPEIKPFELSTKVAKEEFLENYHGKVIVIDSENTEFYQVLAEKYGWTQIEQKQIRIQYRGMVYQIITAER